MNTFQQALSEWLSDPANTQAALAAGIGKTQTAVQRYARGHRFPDAETARRIDRSTGGAVPFFKWERDFLAKADIRAPLSSTEGPDPERQIICSECDLTVGHACSVAGCPHFDMKAA